MTIFSACFVQADQISGIFFFTNKKLRSDGNSALWDLHVRVFHRLFCLSYVKHIAWALCTWKILWVGAEILWGHAISPTTFLDYCLKWEICSGIVSDIDRRLVRPEDLCKFWLCCKHVWEFLLQRNSLWTVYTFPHRFHSLEFIFSCYGERAFWARLVDCKTWNAGVSFYRPVCFVTSEIGLRR